MSQQVFDWLTDSAWTFVRTFNNPKMPGLTASGEARFSLSGPNRLFYLEQGQLSNGGTFTKRYSFVLDGWRIEVAHADPHNDGQAFQTLGLLADGQGGWSCDASNFCAPDNYVSHWHFQAGSWSMRHDVTGPRKQYQISTHFMVQYIGSAR